MIAVWLVRPPSRSTSPRDDGIEGGGVGGREIAGDQHERSLRERDHRRLHPPQLGDDPLGDIRDVRPTRGGRPAHRSELLLEVDGRVEDGPLG